MIVTQNLWHDRGYELIYRMFPCRCGHGYLRRVEEEEDLPQGGTRKRKKSEREKPKLNICTKLVSQKSVGQYFPDVTIPEKCVRRPVVLQTKDTAGQLTQVIPGLVQPRSSPMRLNLDLPVNRAGDEGQDVNQEEIFNSDDDQDQRKDHSLPVAVNLESNSEELSGRSERLQILQVNDLLRRENIQLREKIKKDQRSYEEYLEFITTENEALKAQLEGLGKFKDREMAIEKSFLRMKQELEIKEKELGDQNEALKVMEELVENEKKTSFFLRGLILEVFMDVSPSPQPVTSKIGGNHFNLYREP